LNTRVISSYGTLTLSGTVNVPGTAATTISTFGGTNQAGVGMYNLTGTLTGSGTLEKAGGGTLLLNPADTSGFSGTIRVGGAGVGQSSVRVTSPTAIGSRTSTGTGAVLDMSGALLELRMNAPELKTTGGSNANVYGRSSSTFFVDHAPGGSAINGTLTLGSFVYEDNATFTIGGRNGYGMSFTSATVNGGNANTAVTNNLQGGGVLSFSGNFWNNNDNGGARTMTIGGAGDTLIGGNLLASAGSFNHVLTKSGAGTLTISSVGSTLDGAVNVSGGTLAITDFRSVTNNTQAINIGSSTTAAVLAIGTSAAADAAGLTTDKVVNLAGTTGGATINANQTGANPVIFNSDFTATGAGSKTLTLGGTSTADNAIYGAIVNNSGTNTTSVTKVDVGTWVLGGTNAYTGATTIANGVLKLQANAAASTILNDASAVTFGAVNVYAGGTLEFVGQAGVNNVENLGALTPTLGSGTIKLTAGAGGTA
jgi:autotransporter-associated beta strand protein